MVSLENMRSLYTMSSITYSFPSPHPPSSFLFKTFRLCFSSFASFDLSDPLQHSSIPLSTPAKPFPSHFAPSMCYSHLNFRLLLCWGLSKSSGTPRANTWCWKANWKQAGWFIDSDELSRYPDGHLVCSQSLAHNSVHSIHKMIC